MPNMTGTQVCSALRARGFDKPVVGLTGDPAGSADRMQFEAAGLTACLDKGTLCAQRLTAMLIERAAALLEGHGTTRDIGAGALDGVFETSSRRKLLNAVSM